MRRRTSGQADPGLGSGQVIAVFDALLAATPPLDEPLPVGDRKLQRHYAAREQALRRLQHQQAAELGASPEEEAENVEYLIRHARRIWSAALGAEATVS